MNSLEPLVRVFVFVLGSIIGSFLNVCIVRLPHGQSVVHPRSRCPHCQTPIQWYDNIPFLSYLALQGRCRNCKKSISPRYFLVEFLTGILFLIFYVRFGTDLILLPYLIMLSGLIVATFIDLEHRIIPDEVSLGGLWVGLGLSILIPQLHDTSEATLAYGRATLVGLTIFYIIMQGLTYLFRDKQKAESVPDQEDGIFHVILFAIIGSVFLIEPLSIFLKKTFLAPGIPHLFSFEAALLGFLIGGGAIYSMGLLGDLIFRKESMGGGDVKLLAMVGAFLGWKLALLAFIIAPLFGAVFGIIVKLRTRESVIAYGPFLVMGSLISLFWGHRIIALIFNTYGM